MRKRALIEHRPWLLISVAVALAFYFLWNNPIGGTWLILLKGSAVGFLAIYAARRANGIDAAILVIVLAFSAAADMAFELSFEAGAVLSAIANIVAVGLYLRNRRERPTISQSLTGLALIIGVPVVVWMLSNDVSATIYGVSAGMMSCFAWTSRFPRYRVGIGAVLYVVSDFLVFSRMSTFDLGALPDALIWPLYYSGQLMIATGVVQTLRGENPAR